MKLSTTLTIAAGVAVAVVASGTVLHGAQATIDPSVPQTAPAGQGAEFRSDPAKSYEDNLAAYAASVGLSEEDARPFFPDLSGTPGPAGVIDTTESPVKP